MAATYAPAERELVPLTGAALVLAGFLLALGNFMVVLDITIANVSVPNIAGGLAVSPNQGTWVITSYSVAEAIVVPLAGWLSQRFGALRVFVIAMLGFALCSALCGIAPSFGWLVAFRVMQGACGAPMMPMSQTLLMRIFPPQQRSQALGLWAMTTVVAPIAGPILGGTICDNMGWPWIFYINVPVALTCAFFAWRVMGRYNTAPEKRPVDLVGLGLLIVFVGALQILLDKGRELDWFDSPFIVSLSIVAAVGFGAFLIWELTEEHPIVDLRVFRHRGFASAVTTLSLGFAAYFASIVLVPLWLQTNMGYTASWSGYTTAWGGVLAIFMSPIVPRLMGKIDSRFLITFGVFWLCGISFMRAGLASNASYWIVAAPFILQGLGIPFFFIPTNQLVLTSVTPAETASAAWLSNFMRTISAAFGTSIVTTAWDNATNRNHVNLAGALNNPAAATHALTAAGLTPDQALSQLDNLVQGQAVMTATDQIFMATTVTFLAAACLVWLAPKVKPPSGPMAAGH